MSFGIGTAVTCEDSSCPPSPADERTSKRLSWGNFVQKLSELKSSNQNLTTERWNGSETGSVGDMSLTSVGDICLSPESPESGVYWESHEQDICGQIMENIALTLADTDACNLLKCSRLVLPDRLLQNIGLELLHLACSEPCGLRGALIDLCVEQEEAGGLVYVEQLAVDSSLVPTFQLTLVLRPAASGLWPKVQKLFKGPRSPQRQRQTHTLTLSTGFRAIKKKLYTSGEVLIEEC